MTFNITILQILYDNSHGLIKQREKTMDHNPVILKEVLTKFMHVNP